MSGDFESSTRLGKTSQGFDVRLTDWKVIVNMTRMATPDLKDTAEAVDFVYRVDAAKFSPT